MPGIRSALQLCVSGYACLLSVAGPSVGQQGSFSLRPGEVALQEVEPVVLCAVEADGQEPGVAAKPAETAATQPAPGEQEQPATASWPPGLLQDLLNIAGLEMPMKNLGIRAYGYVEAGFTGILHGGGSSRLGLPLRVFDARKPDNLRLNQLKITLDRPVDTSKSFDLGARGDFIYGTDSRLIHSYGLLDKQRHDIQPDLEQFFAEMWIKTGEAGTGLDIIFGKWVTPIGFEVIDAPGNWLYSRSMLFGFAIPFTHTGVKATYYFNPTNSVYFAAVRGWDVFKDNNMGATWLWGGTISGKEQVGSNPRCQLTLNFAAGPEQFSNPTLSGLGTSHDNPGNRYLVDVIWTYRYTEKLTQVLNGDFGWENANPNAIDSDGVVAKRDADWYGLAYYLNYLFNDYLSGTARAEWFRDHRGVRTGFQGDFFEVTTGITITPFPKDKDLRDLSIRPELRWDWSANNQPFAGPSPTDDWQMTAAFDVIWKF